MAFGHKFEDRVGHTNHTAENANDRSPIFIQFLEAVFQCQAQSASSFEFNEDLLLFLAKEVVDCRFGTFLCNNARERAMHGLSRKTPSVWSEVLHNRQQFTNPQYTPPQSDRDHLLLPEVSGASVRLWERFHLRDLSPIKLSAFDVSFVDQPSH